MYLKYPMFWKKKSFKFKYFWSYWIWKMRLFKCITGPLSENPFAVNVLTNPENSWNLHKRTFILLFLLSEPNWLGKSYFQSDLRFWDSLITGWLETTSSLVVIERICRYQLKSNYLKTNRLFAIYFMHFL